MNNHNKTKRREKMSAVTFMKKLKVNHQYIYDWLYDHNDVNKDGATNNLYMAHQFSSIFIMGNKPNERYNTDILFERMKVKRGKWSNLFSKSYDWIDNNQALIQMRML